nr:MAG TPA: hypothetical protein [Caudoviricetes sp.]
MYLHTFPYKILQNSISILLMVFSCFQFYSI